MSSVSSAGGTQAALTQSQVRSEIALSVIKLARETQKQSAQLTLQAVEAVANTMKAGRLDVYA